MVASSVLDIPIHSYKERRATYGTKSSAYFNLHNGLFSVKQDGKVQGHGDVIKLTDATFKVSETGRQRVLNERKKNVHAYVHGTLQRYIHEEDARLDEYNLAYYNPYRVAEFVDIETRLPIKHADTVLLINRTIYYK